jgi:DNA polymerase I-like protein with 3'-5' exonuclease and polymerase domains
MQYYLLKPVKGAPRPPMAVLSNATLEQVTALLPERKRRQLWAIDLETRGTAAHAPDNYIVGIAMADQDGCFYIDLQTADDAAQSYLKTFLADCALTAFNVMFDGVFLEVWTGRWLNWKMCSYGMFKNMTSEGFQGQTWGLETAQRNVLGWDESNKSTLAIALGARGLGKADMWQLPADILGAYSAADADAAWQLAQVFADQSTEEQRNYHQHVFLTLVRLWSEQQLRGMWADQQRLQKCSIDLDDAIIDVIPKFLKHPDVAPHVAKFNDGVRVAWNLGEPPRFTKAGKESARWLAWRDREMSWMADKGFNPNSKPQLAWLFFECMGFKPLRHTPKGKPVVDRKVLPTLGEAGKVLASYNLMTKRRGYLSRVMERSAATGLINAQFNSVGTVTTRPGGSSGLNMLQMPKVPEFLWALRARDGHKLIQADAEAIEPVVLAQMSQDPSLLQIYGPDAKPNQDVYLFVASKIPALGKEIIKYYDPAAPTAEGLAQAKKLCSRDRDIAKTVHLASLYGAYPPKIHETLVLGGIDISLAEVEQIHADYWRVFAGVKRWQQALTDIWHSTGGWIPSLLGRPLPIAQKLLKDIVNRHTQTSGHEFLQMWVAHTDRLRRERGVEMYPWLVDYYDEMIFEAPEGQAEAAAKCIDDALAFTNESLGMSIPIRGPSMIADNLAMIKCKNYDKWLAEQAAPVEVAA